MKKLYSVATFLSATVGFFHFFAPWIFQWYSYIPNEYNNLIVGIDWTNYCFSLLLFGLSAILFSWREKIINKNSEALTMYCLLVIVWIFRLLLTIVNPLPLTMIASTQFIGTTLIMVLLLIPYLYYAFFL